MSIGLCIMIREDRKTGKRGDMSKLAVFLQDELARRKMPQTELERLSGIPDSTLDRIISGEVAEPRASQIAQIARGLDMSFWRLMQIAGYTTETPGDPDEEAQSLATNLQSQPDLKAIMDEAAVLPPEDRDAVRLYIADLTRRHQQRDQRQRRRRKTRSSEVEK